MGGRGREGREQRGGEALSRCMLRARDQRWLERANTRGLGFSRFSLFCPSSPGTPAAVAEVTTGAGAGDWGAGVEPYEEGKRDMRGWRCPSNEAR